MTSEEYKKEQASFIAEMTAEKLERLKQSYQSWLRLKEDENYLEPINELKSAFSSVGYYELIEEVFDPMSIGNGELCILVIPSFAAEFQVKFLQAKTQLISLKEQLWSQFYNGKLVNKQVKVREIKIPVEDKGLFVKDVLSHILRSKKSLETIGHLDGVEYYFIFNDSGKIKIAFKNASEDENSVIGNLIRHLNTMIAY